jgi:hypothetical protein
VLVALPGPSLPQAASSVTATTPDATITLVFVTICFMSLPPGDENLGSERTKRAVRRHRAGVPFQGVEVTYF